MVLPSSLPPEFDRGVVTSVHQGDCHVSSDPNVTFSTVLGSCISACVRDRVANIGGMNHFLLAEQSGSSRDRFGASARYGAFAMEQLINKVLSAGTGYKPNLEIKVFGGGKIATTLDDVGAKNIEFIRSFLHDEGYITTSEDLGGSYARRVLFKPHSGRAFVKRLDADVGANVAREELAIARRRVVVPAPAVDIELF
ncbi:MULTISPECIES: chemotaxis protein CheD [unclassified Devosia]|uniref:chemotaxis protein CheD n=1 Tax=unclassified Devosia TaxID=196773 RepID=UPI00145E0782|nr:MULTISPECIES: chemotaxis protein CheD [unclassified Devosia]MBJ7578618.1 chemotaxis protein CheD [Devosia sp. MC532]MBK1795419.1 chemotaxis protein CheD [Devosia sp. WQ 349K1]QMW62396.1 chemotaxis protein CheD [Devosia sp. MC521]